MRFKIVALLFLVFPLTLSAQYSTTWYPGVTDISGNLATVNAWKLLPGGAGCQANSLTMGADGFLMCLGGDGYPYSYDQPNLTWKKWGTMGASVHQLAVGDVNDVWSLQTTTHCSGLHSGIYGIFYWNGTTWNQPNSAACLAQLTAMGQELAGVSWDGTAWDCGTDYLQDITCTQISGGSLGPNLSYVSAVTSSMMCGTNGTQVYVLDSGGAFNLLPHQPNNANSGVYGCVYENDQNGQADSVYVWGASLVGVQRYDINSDTWSDVVGINTAKGLTTAGKGLLLGLDSAGHPYHLNVYAGYIAGTISGSWTNGCGGSCQNITPSPVHTATIQVQLPHGMVGNKAQNAGAPGTQLNATSYDYSAQCDPLLGANNDQECIPQMVAGNVFCSFVGSQIFSSQGPPPINATFSVNGRSFDGSISYYGYTVTPLGAFGFATCGITENACAPQTAPTCPTTAKTHTVRDRCTGSDCTALHVNTVLLNFCELHDMGSGGAWRILQEYSLVNGEVVCSGTNLFFGGIAAFPVKCQ